MTTGGSNRTRPVNDSHGADMNTTRLEAQRGRPTTHHDPRARLLAGLPVAERRMQLAGISTAVLEGGAGSPLVLLHGPGESAPKWLRVLPELVALL